MTDILADLLEVANDDTEYSGLQKLCRRAADEIERLHGIVVVAKAYATSYLQDEARERDLCVSGRQHELAQALCHLVKEERL